MKKLTFEEFNSLLEKDFSQTLTHEAILISKDFWENMEKFIEGIKNNKIYIKVEPLFLTLNFPKYGRYKSFNGASILLIVVGIIFIFFKWKFSLLLLSFSILLRAYSNKLKKSSIIDFRNSLLENIRDDNIENGFVKLTCRYIAGVIQLETEMGTSDWPQVPSDVFSGGYNSVSQDDLRATQMSKFWV